MMTKKIDSAKEFEKLLEGAITANEAQKFTTLEEKLSNLQKIVINLVEAKEEDLCEQKIAAIKQKDLLTKEIKARLDVVKAKMKFYKKFYYKLKTMKAAYNELQK